MLISGSPVGPTFKAKANNAVWSPSTKKRLDLRLDLNCNMPAEPPLTSDCLTFDPQMDSRSTEGDDSSPVWRPFGAPYDGPQFRPVRLEVSQKTTRTAKAIQNGFPKSESEIPELKPASPKPSPRTEPRVCSLADGGDFPADLATTSTIFTKSGWSSHLPPSQSPTVTLLQKAREGHLPKGAVYIEEMSESTPIPRNAVLLDQKVSVEGNKVHTDSLYAVPTRETETSHRDVKAPSKYDGIGPTEYGIPVGLRTGVKEEYASDWYKTMYKSLHKNKFPNDTGQATHLGGYMSEPEIDRKADRMRTKYTADYRRKPEKSTTHTAKEHVTETSSSRTETVVRSEPKREVYRVEPRSIADYEPGRSSLAEKEFQKFWSDFWESMDDLEHMGISSTTRQQGLAKRWPNVLLTDGYESDSTLIRKTGRSLDVDEDTQKQWYKDVQKGGEIPIVGLRKAAPEKNDSPHQYQETEVNIHFKSPIRHLEKESLDEEELKRRQEETAQKLYEEERKRKQQQELAEIEMRKHSDFFTPSQKSPIPLNRYDNPFDVGLSTTTIRLTVPGGRELPHKTMARTIYPFTAKTPRELSLNKGDILYINKQIDRNWYEGEHHGLVGIIPASYVEIIPAERAHLQPRKATEGEARVKFNFRAQTPAELSLFKGEKVVLTRRVDCNWYEGRLGAKKGMFPVSYVEVFREPEEMPLGARPVSPRPPASPVNSPIVSSSPPKHNEGPTFTTSLRLPEEKPPVHTGKNEVRTSTVTQTLHIDTYNEPIPYRALYAYRPQSSDELELREGDTVYVMEKCDDGWYVGTSLRTGTFGTFPGNYVDRI